jgi:hypothetical protein
MPCSPLKVSRRFRGKCRPPPFSGSKISQTRNQQVQQLPASCWFLAWFIHRPWRWMGHVPPKRWLTFNRLQAVISQKTEIFIISTVRTSNTTRNLLPSMKPRSLLSCSGHRPCSNHRISVHIIAPCFPNIYLNFILSPPPTPLPSGLFS